MTKPIVISTENWYKLEHRLRTDYPPSVTMIRTKMRDVLGFTPRTHEEWIEYDTVDRRNIGWGTKECIQTIHLDFYNEPKRTMFMLKYSEYLHK
jgi:hypothetical protein